MSIVPLFKATLYGPAAERDAVLDGLQRLGSLHLTDLRPDAAAQGGAAEDTAAREALQWLEDSPVRRHPAGRGAPVDLGAVLKEALELRDCAHALEDEREQLRMRAAELEPWGDFVLPDWARAGALKLWFYVVPLRRLDHLAKVQAPWKIAARDHRSAYVVVSAAEAPAEMPGDRASLDPRPLSAIRARLADVERELEELEYRRVGLTLHAPALRAALDDADDRAARDRAGKATLEQDGVFAVQGWVPQARKQALRRYAADGGLALTLESPGPTDTPPTLLDNPEPLRGGEGMVTFYKTPGYRMWDPSKAVFLGFAVFFGMIFSDAGYGVLLAIATLAFRRRLDRRLRGLLVALSTSAIAYGVLVGSYFGVEPQAGSWLSRLHLLHADDQRLMMLISIGVGVAHLTIANLVSAWRRRGSLALLGPIGWTAVLIGGFVAGASPAHMRSGLSVVASGLTLVLLFSSEHPFSVAPRALLSRLLEGLKSLTEISKVFGDVLSYLRLFALGLAAIKLAEAFNSLAAGSFALRGAGVLLGILVLVVGHAINFAMGIMGGVVHGLRLNVIEFFNWSLPEEGVGYRAFSRKAAEEGR